MSTHTHRQKWVSVLWNLSVWHAQFIRTLSPESPGLPGGPEAPGGPGRPYFKQDLILHTSYINNATHTKKKKERVTFAQLTFSLFSCKVVTHGRKECMRQYGTACWAVNHLRGTFYLSTAQCSNGWTLWDSICRVSRATVSDYSS